MKKRIIAAALALVMLVTLAGCDSLVSTSGNNSRYESTVTLANNIGGGVKSVTLAIYATAEDLKVNNILYAETVSNANGTAFATDAVWTFRFNVSELDATDYDAQMNYESYINFIEGKDRDFNYKQIWNYYMHVTYINAEGKNIHVPSYGPVELKLGKTINLKLVENVPSGSDVPVLAILPA